MNDKNGEVFLDLEKAMNGLRRSPLFWYMELKDALVQKLKFESTAEATVFRKLENGRLTLLLAYVDDLLICSEDPAECQQVAQQLSDCYKCKKTGFLERDAVGSLDFLGRQIARAEAGGPLTLGLPATYWDDIEATAELGTLKATDVPPSLKQFQKEEGDPEDEECSVQEQERFRSVLGKLSLVLHDCTDPLVLCVVAVNVSVKASGQRTEGDGARAEVCEGLERNGSGLWSRKHQGMERYLATGSGSGRRLLESQISSRWHSHLGRSPYQIVVKEDHGAVSLICRGRTVCSSGGLKGDAVDQEVHDWEMSMYSDSESAVHIGNMFGLLRRVRHLELRVDVLQYATQHRKLSLHYVQGTANPADLLTKPSDRSHLKLFLQAFGLSRSAEEEELEELVTDLLVELGPLSSHNKRKVAEGVEKGMRRILGCLEEHVGRNPGPQEEELQVVVEEGVASGAEVDELDENEEEEEESGEEIKPKLVRFEDSMWTLRSMPRRWHKVIPKQWQSSLYWWLAGAGMLVIEVCCEVGSAMSCKEKEIPYIGLTVDFRVETVVLALRLILRRRGPVLLWLSTPCTSGSRIRFLNRLSKWPARYQAHLVIWRALHRIFVGFESRPQMLVGREWPQGCDLVYCRAYFRVAKLIGLSEYAIVNRCCLDGFKKTWSVACNDSYFADLLKTGDCKCRDAQNLKITESGKYSRQVAAHVVKAASKAMMRLQKSHE